MNEAVFISDLHLNPDQPDILARFKQFIQWAGTSTRNLYILGDFFHVWPGDDALDTWSADIAEQLAGLDQQGVSVFYIHGNRDFLLGNEFANRANMQILPDPSVIILNGKRILLTHGDQYCTHDRPHQWLRRLTRNRWFPSLFLRFPLSVRSALVSRVRAHSEQYRRKPKWTMDIVPSSMMTQMQHMRVSTVIHGHIHQPGMTLHPFQHELFQQYVLSDWDVIPQPLCYNSSSGFYFIPFTGELYYDR